MSTTMWTSNQSPSKASRRANICPMAVRANCLCQANTVIFFRFKNIISLSYFGTSTTLTTTKASLDVCHDTPLGVPHPVRYTLVPRPLLHLILVDFSGNLVHLRSFVFDFAFEPMELDTLLDDLPSIFPLVTLEQIHSPVLDRMLHGNFRDHPTQKPPAPITRTA